MQILMIKSELGIIVINMELNLSMQTQKVYLGKGDKSSLSCWKYRFCFHRQIFCDFGEEFQVVDTNGETPLTHIVTGITQVCIR